MSEYMFSLFVAAFPPDEEFLVPVNAGLLDAFVKRELGVPVPPTLLEFWRLVGSGYFGGKDIYFFGDGLRDMPRDSFQNWNMKDFWRDIYPPPMDGGPIFFAETCFGDQLGFRWDSGNLVVILFAIDTFESFVLAGSIEELFADVLSDKNVLLDRGRLINVQEMLGPLKPGYHYAPKVSPILGGGGEPENFVMETPNVHFRTAIAIHNAVKSVHNK